MIHNEGTEIVPLNVVGLIQQHGNKSGFPLFSCVSSNVRRKVVSRKASVWQFKLCVCVYVHGVCLFCVQCMHAYVFTCVLVCIPQSECTNSLS